MNMLKLLEKNNMIFNGVLTALITPFQNGALDLQNLKNLINQQIDAKVDAIVVAGSTGEGSNLSNKEYYELVSGAVKCSSKRIPIIAGTASISTALAVEKVQNLCKLGIDGIMCTTPYYIKPEQEGLYQHFKTIHDISNLPIMLYVNPSRTSCDLLDNTLLKLASLNKIVAIKDASNDLMRPLRILPLCNNLNLLTGDDSKLLAYNANGGKGCVSVIANVLPKTCKRLDMLWSVGNIQEALKIQQKLTPFFIAVFSESNPIGIKYCASKLGLCNEEIKAPLTTARLSTIEKIDPILTEMIKLENNV